MTRRLPIIALAGLLVAADHVDAPQVVEDPATDLTDLYAWMSPDAAKLNLAITITAEQFSPGVQYVFHVSSAGAYGGDSSEVAIICTFDDTQRVTCWVGDEPASADKDQIGISDSGQVTVFTGRRQDAFYFNAEGFSATLAAVRAAAPNLVLDPAGCPQLDAPTSAALVGLLGSNALGGPPRNFFAGVVGTLVLQVDKSLVTAGGPIVGVWASTRR